MITQLVVVTNNIAHQNNMSICLKLFDKQKLKNLFILPESCDLLLLYCFILSKKAPGKTWPFQVLFFCHEWVLPDSDSGSLSDHLPDKLQRIRTARIQS